MILPMLPTCQLLESSPRPGFRCWVHGAGTSLKLPDGLRDCDECVFLGRAGGNAQLRAVERKSDGKRFTLHAKLIDHPVAWWIDGQLVPETDERAKRVLREELASERNADRAALIEWFISRAD